MGRSRRRGPSDPAEISRLNALKRGMAAAAERQARKTPEAWGVSAEILHLPTSGDVSLVRGARDRVIAANRSDPFDLLHAAGGLTDQQHAAARRLFRDWCLRAGVRDKDRQVLERIDGGRRDPSAMVTDAMVDAGRRIACAMKGDTARSICGIGPVNAKLLEALISPMVDEGRIIAWRGVVQRVTGETERHAQGAVVRQACENLAQHHEDYDAFHRRARTAAPGAA
jgi:hypothetical protein